MLTDPTRSTPPLTEDFPAAIDNLLPAIQFIWRKAFGFELEAWQVSLLRRLTETYPDGHPRAGELRYRQVVISLGRQNGKTEIAAALGLWGLLRRRNQLVIGIASSAEQARLVYKRTMQAIASNPSLGRRFKKLTDTRGLRAKDGGTYEMRAAKGAALQGLPNDLGICDELHLLQSELWDALISGTGGRPNTLVVGITTAGDENSDLLKRLYDQGDEAIDDEDTRLGFFCWEAPEDTVPPDDATLLAWLRAANPALASGRLDASNVLTDVKSLPKPDAIRYRLNRFTAATNSFISLGDWQACASREPWPEGREVYAIDRTPEWGYASVVRGIKAPDGRIHTRLVASIVKPDLEQLVSICVRLWASKRPITFIVESYGLKELGYELKKRGIPCYVISGGEVATASSMLYAKVKTKTLFHDNQPLLAVQMPRAIRRNLDAGFRISRKDSSIEIDGVMAEALAVYGAETRKAPELQLY